MSSSTQETKEKVILVTGGAGFVGSHMVIHLVKTYPHYTIVNLDKLDYCSSLKLLEEVEERDNYHFVKGDILSGDLISLVLKTYNVNVVIHFAAQTHVDNSFGNSISFTRNNVLGTHTLIERCRQHDLERFVHISTDEVYGESANMKDLRAIERTPLLPTNPYAATKAGAEHLVMSYYRSWGFPVVLTRCNNIYGPHQYPEKVIPKWLSLLERGKPLPLHGDGSHRRSYLYVDDVVKAYDAVIHRGVVGEVYNIASQTELTNKALAESMCALYKVDPSSSIVKVSDRAFNDWRYHIDGGKMTALGWCPAVDFAEGMARTRAWYSAVDIDTIWGTDTSTHALLAHPIIRVDRVDV